MFLRHCDFSVENPAENEGYAYRLYGTVDSALATGRLYLRLQNDTLDATFEAFPITETALLQQAEAKDGFSLFLNPADVPAGTYKVSLISENGIAVSLSTINLT